MNVGLFYTYFSISGTQGFVYRYQPFTLWYNQCDLAIAQGGGIAGTTVNDCGPIEAVRTGSACV